DCLALALLLGSPEVQLEGVTCVYGDVLLRARMALKLLALRDRRDVPVLAGATKPLLGRQPVYWAGHEGQGLLEPGDDTLKPTDEGAVDYLIRTIMDNPGAIHLLAIGPLTNAALAFLREPRLAHSLAGLTIMGGAARGPGNFHLPYAEHNIVCDPEAAHVVMSAGMPLTLVPLDVTTKGRIGRAGAARIRAADTPFHTAVAGQVERYPRFQNQGWTYLHDPLAAAILLQSDLVSTELLHVEIALAGHHLSGATLLRAPAGDITANATVALSVDTARAEGFIISRIASA
ncbi:MAG: nucleoside hydrolase, partial [Thermomicrobiales bacterium]